MEKTVSKNCIYGIYTGRLLNSVLENREPPALPEQFDLEGLFTFHSQQSVANMAYCGLKKLNIPQEKLKNYYDDYKMMLLREARFEVASQQVFSALEKAGIPFIPLKGSIIKKLFPQESLRSFTDVDIYIGDKVEQTGKVMESLGFSVKSTTQHDISYFKKPSLSFEMHSRLFEDDYSFDGYFDNPFERAKPIAEGSCHYLFSDEDFFIHVFCHLYKHFTFGGCGLRQFMDIFVLTKKLNLDYDYINKELEKLKLTDFFETVKKVNSVVFKGEKPDGDMLDICDYIFSNGTFGIYRITAMNEFGAQDKNILAWKISYFANRWGLSYSRMKENYKVLEKVPVLLPFCWIHKAFRVLFFRRDVLKSQIKDIDEYNQDYSKYLKHIWEISGVKR
ncbi:MAG: nucleotidyltransferase family protein [Ruminococcus sp.]